MFFFGCGLQSCPAFFTGKSKFEVWGRIRCSALATGQKERVHGIVLLSLASIFERRSATRIATFISVSILRYILPSKESGLRGRLSGVSVLRWRSQSVAHGEACTGHRYHSDTIAHCRTGWKRDEETDIRHSRKIADGNGGAPRIRRSYIDFYVTNGDGAGSIWLLRTQCAKLRCFFVAEPDALS